MAMSPVATSPVADLVSHVVHISCLEMYPHSEPRLQGGVLSTKCILRIQKNKLYNNNTQLINFSQPHLHHAGNFVFSHDSLDGGSYHLVYVINGELLGAKPANTVPKNHIIEMRIKSFFVLFRDYLRVSFLGGIKYRGAQPKWPSPKSHSRGCRMVRGL